MEEWQIDKTIEVPPGTLQVETPGGFVDIVRAFRTDAMPVWELHTLHRKFRGAQTHLLLRADNMLQWLSDFKPGDFITTVDGLEAVTDVIPPAEDAEWERMYDFEIDSEDHLYYTDGFVSHNSITIGCRQLANAHLIPRWSSLYVCPHGEHKKTYANKLRDLEIAFQYYKPSHKFRSNLGYKEFSNGAKIELVNVLTSAAAARGKSADELLYDEYQRFEDVFEPEVEQCQSATSTPVRIYAGTSTTLDSPLEGKYQSSSMGTWMMRTGYSGDDTNKRWANCGDGESVVSMMSPKGLKCPHTGHILDPADGVWAHQQAHRLELNEVGYHIPKFLVPQFGKTLKGWMEIYTSFLKYPRDMFLNEVIGIPTESGSREITEGDLKRICTNPDNYETRKQKAKDGYYKIVVSGCDWGGSEFNPVDRVKLSLSAHVILGLDPYDVWQVLHMRTYPGMDYRMVVHSILAEHFEFQGNALSSDYGVGMAYNSWLRQHPKMPPERHLVFCYGGSPKSPILQPFNMPDSYNYYTLNKTESITELFAAIKKLEPEILCYDWAEAHQHLTHFLNTYRVPHEAVGGGGSRRWRYIRSASKSDDIVHAMNFALCVGRLLQGKAIFQDEAVMERVHQMIHGRQAADPWNSGDTGLVVG